MEQAGQNHDVRLFIAHDSPMQGSNTPISTQFLTRHIHGLYINAPISAILEFHVPAILNFLEFMSFGAINISFPSVNNILTIQILQPPCS